MTTVSLRRAAGLSLAWGGLVLLVAGLALWVASYVVDDFSGFYSAAAFVVGFLVLAGSSFLLRGTRDSAGRLDPVDEGGDSSARP